MKWYGFLLLEDFVTELILFVACLGYVYSGNWFAGLVYYLGSCFVFNIAIPFYGKLAEGRTQDRYHDFVRDLRK